MGKTTMNYNDRIETIEITKVEGGWKAMGILRGTKGFLEIESQEPLFDRYEAWQEINKMLRKAYVQDIQNTEEE